jgi:hypothetical protein
MQAAVALRGAPAPRGDMAEPSRRMAAGTRSGAHGFVHHSFAEAFVGRCRTAGAEDGAVAAPASKCETIERASASEIVLHAASALADGAAGEDARPADGTCRSWIHRRS